MKLTGNMAQQQECVVRVIAWLHTVWERGEAGEPLQPDPFYKRTPLLTPDVVANVIGSIEGIFVRELERYPGYHRNAQGISAGEYLVPPGLDKLPHEQQLAIVQGIDKIMQEYREDEPTPAVRDAAAMRGDQG